MSKTDKSSKSSKNLEQKPAHASHNSHHNHHHHHHHDNAGTTHGAHNADEHKSHDDHAHHSAKMFKDKFWISLALTIPVLVYSKMIQDWFKISPPTFLGSEWMPLIFSTIIFFYGGTVFIKSAIVELKNKQPGMMTLISTAIFASYFYSIYLQFAGSHESFFWELATLITIMLLGHWLEMAAVLKAQSSLDDLAKLLPDKATKIDGKKQTQVMVSELKVGDRVLVKPGGRIPVDGLVVAGRSFVDESAITGESQRITKAKGNNVVAGTLNQDGSLTVEVNKVGADTMISGIMKLVAEAQSSKSKTQVLADRAAFWLTFFAFGFSGLALIYWSFEVSFSFALERAVTVLIIACPHALGLAIPLVVSISTAISAKKGILVRQRLAYENARNINYVVFDKTGTLTQGNPEVADVVAMQGYLEKEILTIASSLEQHSEHHLARAITVKALNSKVHIDDVAGFKALPGTGVQATLGSEKYFLVNKKYLVNKNIKLDTELAKSEKNLLMRAKTIVYLVKANKQVIGMVALSDNLRAEAKAVIKDLKSRNIKTAILSGDSKEVARDIAKQIGVTELLAEVLPEQKSEKIKSLQSQGYKVAFVGDGINDSPALARADVGVAIGAGTDIAIKSADIVLVNNNLNNILGLIDLSKATYTKMTQNLIWATGYNVLAIPLAAGVLQGAGFVLSPAVGAVIMSLSTIIVAFNAQLLRRVEIN